MDLDQTHAHKTYQEHQQEGIGIPKARERGRQNNSGRTGEVLK